jgi:drug/metabolite transporter (DMT)-like permease
MPAGSFYDPLLCGTHHDHSGSRLLTDKSADRRVKRCRNLPHNQYRGHLLAALDRLSWAGFAAVVAGVGAPVVLVIGAGLQFAPVARAGALFQGTVPLAVACLAAIVLKERITTIRKAGLVLVVCGVSMIGGLDLSSFGSRQSVGHLLFLSATCMWACCTVAIRRARIDGLHAAAIAAVVSLLYLPV